MKKKSVKVKVKSLIKPDTKVLVDMANYYDIPLQSMTLNSLLNKMSETLELYLKLLQQILQPEDFHSLHECAVFDDIEKTKMFELYSRIITLHREILGAVILNEEKNSISIIKYAHSEIMAVKPMMLDVVKKMQHSWNVDFRKTLQKRTMHYFG